MTTQQELQQDHAQQDRLYQLLPVIHRLRDHEQGEPLRNLLQVIAEQVTIVEDDIQQMYDNWFIETCDDWVVPYIGDLIGYTSLFEAGEPGGPLTAQAQVRNKILAPRREVANTIRYRRRKGSLALLEQLASDVAGWRAFAVEFYTRLAWTQHLNHQRLERGRIVDLRNGSALELLDGPFDAHAHTVDVRRPNSIHTRGRHNIPSVGLFVWRLKSYSVTQTQACCLEDVGTNCYTFSALGNDTSLYVKSHASQTSPKIGDEVTAPVPIRRRAFSEPRSTNHKGSAQASASFYGDIKSLAIWADNWPAKNTRALDQPIPPEQIIPADLSEWQSQPPRNCIAVDPLLGRIVFPPSQRPKGGVRVSYHYGFSADIGGGEYRRAAVPAEANYRVVNEPRPNQGEFKNLADALSAWKEDQLAHAVIEIATSRVYEERLEPLEMKKPHKSLQIRAASGCRPVLRLQNFRVDLPDAWTFRLAPGSQVTLEGLLLYERGVFVEGPSPVAQSDGEDSKEQKPSESSSAHADDDKQPQQNSCPDNNLHPLQPQAQFTIRHCTLVPGWQLINNCDPKRPAEPSLQIAYVDTRIVIEQSIVGSIMVIQNAVTSEPTPIYISDSIVDATSSGGEGAESTALSDNELSFAHATLTIRDSTILGKVMAHAIDLAENTIFDDIIRVVRSQRGCMRFSYIAPGSRTPRRINCQPDLVEQPVRMDHQAGKLDEEEYKRCLDRVQRGVRPSFNCRRYGMPTYCQLADACPEEISRGADDESEMGVFHDLYQPQRLANLQARLDEYTPAGMDAGIILVN